eukprot:9471066-Pyramimonas_sp.AAC.2
MPAQHGANAATRTRRASCSQRNKGTRTVFSMLRARPETASKSRKNDCNWFRLVMPSRSTMAKSSAQAREQEAAIDRRARRRSRSVATAKSSGDRGQPCLIPRLISNPG